MPRSDVASSSRRTAVTTRVVEIVARVRPASCDGPRNVDGRALEVEPARLRVALNDLKQFGGERFETRVGIAPDARREI